MGNKYAVQKFFLSPPGSSYDGFFCVYESYSSFWGYMIEKEIPNRGVLVYLKQKKPTNRRYINCERLLEFPKNIHYERIFTRYRLKELRKAIEEFETDVEKQTVLDGKKYEIKDFDYVTEEQRENRKNPEYHKKLKEAKERREIAIMQNNKQAADALTIVIDDLNHKLGYYETQNTSNAEREEPAQGSSLCIVFYRNSRSASLRLGCFSFRIAFASICRIRSRLRP